jgi:hypothetical protein
MVGVSVEAKIRKISRRADELRKLLDISEDMTQITLSFFANSHWHVEVRPSLLTFGDQTHLFTRGYHGKNLMETLDEALDGTNEELTLYKKGLTRGIK